MPPDLTKLSDDDLSALRTGDLTKLSDEGLVLLRGGAAPVASTSWGGEVTRAPATPTAPRTDRTQNVVDQWLLEKFGPQLARAPDIQGSIPGRFIQGAADLPVGAMQLGANVVGLGDVVNQRLSDVYQATEAQRGPDPGFDWARLAGNLANPVPWKAGAAIPRAATIPGRAGIGVGAGATVGAATPVVGKEDISPEEYWGTKGAQTLISAAVGGAIPPGFDFAKWLATGARRQLDLVLPGGASRILTDYQRAITGEAELPEVVRGLESAKMLVPGSKPKADEALAGISAGSPLTAHQKAIATKPGGTSAAFGRRAQEQQAALEKAEEALETSTAPIRDRALRAANAGGGVVISGVVKKINGILRKPEVEASKYVAPSLKAIVSRIEDTAKESGKHAGKIDAKALYTIRKEVGEEITVAYKKFSGGNAPSRGLVAGLERQVQKHIDDAIEAAEKFVGPGGQGMKWKDYLAEYHRQASLIREDIARRKLAARPAQRTELGSGRDVAESTRLKLPQMLTRPMMATNAVLKRLGVELEKRMGPEEVRRYLNPQVLADELKKMPLQVRGSTVANLIERGYIPAISAGAAVSTRVSQSGE